MTPSPPRAALALLEFPMKFVPFATLAALAALPAAADEGMWTFDNPPAAAIEQKYGAKLDAAWLNRVREAEIGRASCRERV